jgi:hypothetical protein
LVLDRFSLRVGAAISDIDAKQDRHTLRLRHSSDLHFKTRWKELRLGRITYAYTIDARSMLIDVEVTLEIESSVEATDVVLDGSSVFVSWFTVRRAPCCR